MAGLKIKIDTSEAEKASQRLKKDLNLLGREAVSGEKDIRQLESRIHKGMGSDIATKSIKSLTVALSAMGIAAGYALKRLVEESIKAASALEEVSSKYSIVFQGQTQAVDEWTKKLVDGYAMSTREAKQYLSSIQDLLVPMGMQARTAANLSNEIVKLAADLGSFNNLPTAQVMDNIQSALVGEYESMKKYGVILNQTLIEQEALNIGLADTKNALTIADKAQAAYSLIVKSSAAAMGDMDRTADGYANTTKRLSSEWEDFTAVLGEKFLPVASSVKGFFADILDNITASMKPDSVVKLTSTLSVLEKKLREIQEPGNFLPGIDDERVSVLKKQIEDIRTKIEALNSSVKENSLFESGIMKGKDDNYHAPVVGLSEKEISAQKKDAEDRKKALEGIQQEYDKLSITTGQYADQEKRLADLSVDQWYADQLKILKATTPELEKIVALKKLQNQQEENFKNRYSNRDLGMTWDDSDLTLEKIRENTAASDIANRERIKTETETMLDEYFNDIERMEDEFKETSLAMQDVFSGVFSNMSSEVNDFFWEADFSFSNTFKSFSKMITQMIIQMKIVQPLYTSLFGTSSSSGGLLNSLWSGVTGLFSGGSSSGYVGFHSGGVVGSGEGTMRYGVSPSVFNNAPRFHDGLMPDEYPAILKKGEGVFTEGQMSAMGGSSVSVNVVVQNNTSSKVEVAETQTASGGKDIIIMIDEALGSMVSGNRGKLSQVLNQRGLRPQTVGR